MSRYFANLNMFEFNVQGFYAWINSNLGIFITMIKLIARHIFDWIFNGSSANRQYSFESPRLQNFSLPSTIIYYITKTPTRPRGYMKLIQTCKYFTSKQHIVPIGCVRLEEVIHYIEIRRTMEGFGVNQENYGFFRSEGLFEKSVSPRLYLPSPVPLKSIQYKIWLCGDLVVNSHHVIRSLLPKIFRCECRRLVLSYLYPDCLDYDDFMFLMASGSIQELTVGCPVKRKDGTLLLLEDIFEMAPNITELR